MDYDFKNSQWKYDIERFNRWKPWIEKFKDREDEFFVSHVEKMRGWLREIQQRWPQFIKEDEIP